MILFYILVLSLPFVDHGLFGMAIGPLTLEKVLGAACFVYALTYLPKRREFPGFFSSAQSKFFAAYVGMAVCSYLFTAENFDFNDMVGIFFSQFLFFVAIMILVDSRERLENTVLWATASLGVVSLYLIKEWLGAFRVYGVGYRPGWVAGDPNMFSASALIVLPLMFCPILYARKRWQRNGAILSLILTLIGFVLAASRGGFIGLTALLLWHTKSWKRRIIAVALIAAIIAVCFALPHSPLDRLLKPDASDKESSDIRLQLWSVSGKIFHDYPVFGVGLYNFPVYMHKYLPPDVDLEFVVPHNTYLEAAVELGAVGLSLFVGVIVCSVLGAGRLRAMAVSAGDEYLTLLTTGLGSGLIGFATSVMFLSAKHDKLFWFAVFMSATVAPLVRQSWRDKAQAADAAAALVREAIAVEAAPSVPAAEAPMTPLPASTSAVQNTSSKPPDPPDDEGPIRVGNWLTRH
ncbi:MAG: O-antigen ligase family protein [Acidobacteriota bacterium]|nr:O-antigen ligase family protein [Acidobacteriota bacterium]